MSVGGIVVDELDRSGPHFLGHGRLGCSQFGNGSIPLHHCPQRCGFGGPQALLFGRGLHATPFCFGGGLCRGAALLFFRCCLSRGTALFRQGGLSGEPAFLFRSSRGNTTAFFSFGSLSGATAFFDRGRFHGATPFFCRRNFRGETAFLCCRRLRGETTFLR